jgi:L-asparaginase
MDPQVVSRKGMRVAVFATGGTFDKEYNELNGELYFKETHIAERLALGRSRVPTRLQTLLMKDSLYMTTADRQKIASACRSAPEQSIVITQGTDTMEDTAGFLAGKVSGETVVLTGAMVPYKFGSSDGLFNLGSALALAQVLPSGIHVAMNGRYFTWDSVTKNKTTGVFEEKAAAASLSARPRTPLCRLP